MRKLIYAATLLVALVATGIAVADGIEGAKSATAVTGTFTATGSSTSSRTCTTTDGKTVVVTDGKYTGTASSAGSPDLAGPITLRARSVINTTDKVGVVSGSLKIDQTTGGKTEANYTAVYNNGTIAGLATGHGHGPSAKLVANLSSPFDPASGFSSAMLGGGTAGGYAVELGSSSCKPSHPTTEKSEAHGTITALTPTSITVAGLTCVVPSDKFPDITTKFHTTDTVQIRCALVSSVNTLTDISGKKH